MSNLTIEDTMSLTSILNYNNKQYKEFRTLLDEIFPTPKLLSENSIKTESLTKNYALIGTAFDYLLRFTLEKKFKERVFGNKWIAESSLKNFQGNQIVGDVMNMDFESILQLQEKKEENNKLINAKFNDCKKLYNEYISNSNELSVELLEASLFLGRLDIVFRSGPFNNEINLSPENPDDLEDLRSLLENCNLDLFTPKKKIILNPSFGEGSVLVGGADADLIIDNTLIDIKVTKEQKITRQIYNQLIGYYLVYLIGGIEKHKDTMIENLGIYFARYNSLWTIPIDEVGSKDDFEKAIVKLRSKK